MVPGKVALNERVVQVSAGDSHTAALTDDGAVYIWGSFRVSRGQGLTAVKHPGNCLCTVLLLK